MYSVLNLLFMPFQGQTKSRVKDLLLRERIYPGVKDVSNPTLEQARLGVDLVVHFPNKLAFLQLKPNKAAAHITKNFTQANLAIIVCNDRTPQGLLKMRLQEGLDFCR